MYALNTFFRIVRFVSNSFIGLAVGYVLGMMFPIASILELITNL